MLPRKLNEALYKNSRFVGMMKKTTDFLGTTKEVVVRYAPTSGGSATFSDAQASKDASQLARFHVIRKREYQLASIEGELFAAARGGDSSLGKAMDREIESCMNGFAQALAVGAWGGGGGVLGQISAASVVTSNTITLANPSDANNFEVNMQLELSPDQGITPPFAGRRGAPTQVKVTNVNRITGQITCSTPWNTIIGASTGDFIFRRGDYSVKPAGVRGWIPDVDPVPGDNWYGQDRSPDVNRLAGIRFNAGGSFIREAITNAAAVAYNENAMPETCWINPVTWGNLSNELGSAIQFQRQKIGDTKTGEWGFDSIRLYGAYGPIDVIAEPKVPATKFFLTTMADWELASAGPCPQFLDFGQFSRMLQEQNADGYETRVGGYLNYICNNPRNQVNGTF